MTLTDAELRARIARVVAHLDHWGDVVATDAGRRRDRRMVEFQLTAPGDELPVEVLALFREYYRRTADGPWELDKYTYEYLDASHGTRLGYHMHDLGAARHVPHAHCEEAADIPDAERSDHLRAVELDVLEAHAEFMRLWASERAPDCSGYLPLAVPRG